MSKVLILDIEKKIVVGQYDQATANSISARMQSNGRSCVIVSSNLMDILSTKGFSLGPRTIKKQLLQPNIPLAGKAQEPKHTTWDFDKLSSMDKMKIHTMWDGHQYDDIKNLLISRGVVNAGCQCTGKTNLDAAILWGVKNGKL